MGYLDEGFGIFGPKITFSKTETFNKVVALDLKNFGSKHVLWIIDSFCRFVKGKVILNKKADTIVNTITDTRIMCFSIPSNGIYTEHRGEFVNVNMD